MKRTQTQLAEYFGVQRPSLARTIGEMIEEGLIVMQKKTLTVIDRKNSRPASEEMGKPGGNLRILGLTICR